MSRAVSAMGKLHGIHGGCARSVQWNLRRIAALGLAASDSGAHDAVMRKRKRASEPKTERGAPIEPSPLIFPLVGSDVLDVIGSAGVPKREMHDVIHSPDDGIAEMPLGPQQGA